MNINLYGLVSFSSIIDYLEDSTIDLVGRLGSRVGCLTATFYVFSSFGITLIYTILDKHAP